jgi:hypothetical protein
VSWDIPTVSGLAGVVLASLGILGKITGAIDWLRQRVTGPPSAALLDIPRKTLIIILGARANSCRWSMDFFGGRAVMRVICEAKATNVSKYAVQLVGAKMRRPPIVGRAVIGFQADGINDEQLSCTIPSLATRDLRMEFAIEPPVVEEPRSFKADLALLDQFGNEHWLKNVRFRRLPGGRVLTKAG